MAWLTYLGAHAEAPDKIDLPVPASVQAGPGGREPVGCGACHKFGEAGNAGPGPDLTEDRRAPARGRDRAHAAQPRRRRCRPTSDLPPEKFDALVDYLAALR